MPTLAFGVYRMTPEEAGMTTLWALEYGYRHIDTASYYKNERSVGKAVRESGILRDEVFITTKPWIDDIRAARVEAALEKSLRELETDYVDLYLVHWPVGDIPQTWKTMERILASGRARAIGVSNFQPHHLEVLLQEHVLVPAVNQVEIHPYFIQRDLLEFDTRHGIITQARSPLGGQKPMHPDLKEDPVLREIAENHGKSPVQVILRWHVQRGEAVVVKSLKKDRILANSRIFDFSLSESEMKSVSDLDRNMRTGSDPDNLSY